MSAERKGGRVITKSYDREEIVSFGRLRSLTQRDIISKFNKHNKLGIMVKDELKYTLVDTRDLENLIEENERLNSRIEDEGIFQIYHDRLLDKDNPDAWSKLPADEAEFIKLARKSAGLE